MLVKLKWLEVCMTVIYMIDYIMMLNKNLKKRKKKIYKNQIFRNNK